MKKNDPIWTNFLYKDKPKQSNTLLPMVFMRRCMTLIQNQEFDVFGTRYIIRFGHSRKIS